MKMRLTDQTTTDDAAFPSSATSAPNLLALTLAVIPMLVQTIRTHVKFQSIIDRFVACMIAPLIGRCLIAMVRQP